MTDLRDYRDQRVCILGLGYVGLTLAVAMADIGFKVLGVEIRDDVVKSLSGGEAHFHEPGLNERLKRVIRTGEFTVAEHIPADFGGTVFIITVGTPLNKDGKSRLDMVESVAHEVARNLKDGDLVIMRSTVKLGTTRNVVRRLLEKPGKKFDLAFCPERTLEGRALVELRQLPQIVGGVTNDASIRASQLFQFITPTVIRVSDVETAEMIKLVDNAQRDVAFAYANEVASACDAIGISAAEVIQSGKLGYPRTNLPMPGPVGGPCLEKDSHILAEGLREHGMTPEITVAARRINERQPAEIIDYIKNVSTQLPSFPSNPTITLMGLAFKGQPETDDLRGTMARPVMENVRRAFPNAILRGFDSVVTAEQIKEFGLSPLDDLAAAFERASLILILNNHPVYSAMPIETLAKRMSPPAIIYDFWNCHKSDDLHLPNHVTYIALGSHGKARLAMERA